MITHKRRLLDVARALREAPNPKRFKMDDFGGFCGTPHCALGHYAARKDLQKTFSLTLIRGNLRMQGKIWDWGRIARYFGITGTEAFELFGSDGCHFAETPIEAAEYIEGFVAHKWPEAPGLTKLKELLETSTS